MRRSIPRRAFTPNRLPPPLAQADSLDGHKAQIEAQSESNRLIHLFHSFGRKVGDQRTHLLAFQL